MIQVNYIYKTKLIIFIVHEVAKYGFAFGYYWFAGGTNSSETKKGMYQHKGIHINLLTVMTVLFIALQLNTQVSLTSL